MLAFLDIFYQKIFKTETLFFVNEGIIEKIPPTQNFISFETTDYPKISNIYVSTSNQENNSERVIGTKRFQHFKVCFE